MKRGQRNTLIMILLTLPIIAGDIVLAARGKLSAELMIPYTLAFAVIIAVVLFMRKRDGQKMEGDERNERIEGRAFCYSWMLTLYTLFLLLLNRQLEVVSLSIDQCLFLVLAVMLVTNLAFRAALNRKGDLVE
jgi:hypothetical protein